MGRYETRNFAKKIGILAILLGVLAIGSVALPAPKSNVARFFCRAGMEAVQTFLVGPVNFISNVPFEALNVDRSVDVDDKRMWTMSAQNDNFEIGAFELFDNSRERRVIKRFVGDGHGSIKAATRMNALNEVFAASKDRLKINFSQIYKITYRHNHPTFTDDPELIIRPWKFSVNDIASARLLRSRFDEDPELRHIVLEFQITFYDGKRLRKRAYVLPPAGENKFDLSL